MLDDHAGPRKALLRLRVLGARAAGVRDRGFVRMDWEALLRRTARFGRGRSSFP